MTIRATITRTRPNADIPWFATNVDTALDDHQGDPTLVYWISGVYSTDGLTLTIIEEYNNIEDLLAYNAPTLAAVEWLENNVDPYPATVGITISRVIVDTVSNYEYTQEEINSLTNARVGQT